MVALLLTAFAARLAALSLLGDPQAGPTTYEHGEIADNLLAGRGFRVCFLGTDGPTSQQAPWMPTLLAVCSWPAGRVTPAAVFAFQLLQCLAGTATVAAAVWLGRSLFPERRVIGWSLGWAAALFPPHVYMVTHVQAAPWATLGVVALLALVADPRRTAQPRTAISAGLVNGWLLLVDPIFVLAAPIVAWRLVGARRPRRIRTVAVFGGTAALVIAPWLMRNAVVHGEFVFVKSTFGYAFWQGNNAASLGTDKLPKSSVTALAAAHDGSLADRNRALWEARHETLYIDDVLLKPTGYREFAGLGEPARSRLLGAQAGQYVVEHPAEYARRCLRRLRYFLLWDETNPKAMSLAYRASSAVWLAASAIGVLAARRRWATLAPTLLLFAVVTLFHVLTITSARFRIPLEPLGMLWAVVGLEPAVTNVTRHVIRAWRDARRAEADAAERASAQGRRHVLTGPHHRRASAQVRSIARRR